MSICHIKVKDIEMEYATFGSGERAFVILPGVGVKSVMQSAKAVEAAYSMFAQDYTVYLFDPRKNMPDPYPVRQMAADTAVVMRALGIEGADIFGASRGGMLALCIAIDAPELVHKLVVGSSTAFADEEATAGIERWTALAESGDMSALTGDMVDHLYSEKTIGQYREFLIHMNDNVSPEDISRFIIQTEGIIGFDVYDELDQITCPVLVIGVEGDRVIPSACSVKMAEKLGCELYLYSSEYGHCVFDEAPDYKERLLAFFQKS